MTTTMANIKDHPIGSLLGKTVKISLPAGLSTVEVAKQLTEITDYLDAVMQKANLCDDVIRVIGDRLRSEDGKM